MSRKHPFVCCNNTRNNTSKMQIKLPKSCLYSDGKKGITLADGKSLSIDREYAKSLFCLSLTPGVSCFAWMPSKL